MADQLARVVRFKPAVLKMSFVIWTAVMPVLMLPVALIWFVVLIMAIVYGFTAFLNPGTVMYLTGLCHMALWLLLLSCVLCTLLFVTAVGGDDQIHISKDGIVFPLFMSPFLRFRRKRMWSEVARVHFSRYDLQSDDHYGDIVIHFRSGERVNLEMGGFVDVGLKGFEKGELEKFLLACEVLASDAEITTDVVELRDWLCGENREIGKLSYTELWESELSNRFHATVFVPLEPETLLKEGKLKVVRQLAFGGLAAVYLVQREGRELLILKEAVIPANQDDSLKAKALEMFDREARFLAALDHPRIAKVFDHFVEQGRSYLLLERIAGQNFRQVITMKGPQSETVVLKWCYEIAELLVYLHGKDPPIVHRDLTPENLILSDDGHVHLIDFGAANQFLGTVTGTVVGKQAFIAPEQFRGRASLSSDIYAFGGTMYFLLTGKNPLAMSVLKPKSIDARISDEVDELVSACTCQETTGRPEDSKTLLRTLESLLNETMAVK